jgi:hypothetical protein
MKTIVSLGYDAHFVVPTADLGTFLELFSSLQRASRDFEGTEAVFRVEAPRMPTVSVVFELKEAQS